MDRAVSRAEYVMEILGISWATIVLCSITYIITYAKIQDRIMYGNQPRSAGYYVQYRSDDGFTREVVPGNTVWRRRIIYADGTWREP